jgi:acyl-CoA thioester hydrolase
VHTHLDTLPDGTFRLPIRVYYEDTDAGGVVYHANYVKFMERARTEWLRSLGWEQDRLAAELGVIFAVRSLGLEFLRPARFNELLVVSAQVTETRGASLRFEQGIWRSGDGTHLAAGQVRVVSLDAENLRPQPIPRSLLTEISP